MSNLQDCKYCGTKIFWDTTINESRKWRETESKEVHTFEICKQVQQRTKAGHKVQQQVTQDKQDSAPPKTKSDAPKTESLVLSDTEINEIQKKVIPNLQTLDVYEKCIRAHFTNKGETNPNPEKVGLYLKLLMELDKK